MLEVQRALDTGGRLGRTLAILLVVGCAASMVHARWTPLESAALRYGLVASGTALALAIAWGPPLLRYTPGSMRRRGRGAMLRS
jgi:hypothetical protein